MTGFIELHGYRGFSAGGGTLLYCVVLGFVTIGFAPFQITRKLSDLTESLKGILK